MDLVEELKGLLVYWKDRSPIGKVLHTAGFLCSFFAIASLSEAVFDFEGFIATAIDAYRVVSNYLFGWLRDLFNIESEHHSADIFILVCISVALEIWTQVEIVTRRNSSVGILMARLIGTVLGLLVGFVILYTSMSWEMIALALPLLFFFIPLVADTMASNLDTIKIQRYTLICLVAVYFLVAIVATISLGLARAS